MEIRNEVGGMEVFGCGEHMCTFYVGTAPGRVLSWYLEALHMSSTTVSPVG